MPLHRPWLRTIPCPPDEAPTSAMIRPPARIALSAAAAALALAQPLASPLAAQQSFELPPASPSPTPTPAGPADERAGVAIPPRTQPDAAPEPTATPVIQPLPSPSANQPPLAIPAAPPASVRNAGPAGMATGPAAQNTPTSAAPTSDVLNGPLALPTTASQAAPAPVPAPPESTFSDSTIPMQWPQWWPFAAGGLAALVLLGGGVLAWRRRKPKTLRLAAPVAGASPDTAAASEPPRLDLTLEITAATRSVMMFTINYRLTIANRSDRAVSDLNAAAKLVCARGSAGGAAPAGAAQGLESIARIGPHQARSVTGTVQLPLSAIAPLRQGQTPLFIPLVHVTLEGEGLPADTKTFVIGTPSASGRVHPIPLDQPPGSIAGLVAQAVAIPAASAAA